MNEDDSTLLFKTDTWAIKNFSKYCAKAGVREIHFHSLRHTCFTNLANGYGMDSPLPLPQVQKIAGHKDVATTMRYVHADAIENTGSRQWSRGQRKALRDQKSVPVIAPGQTLEGSDQPSPFWSPSSDQLLRFFPTRQIKQSQIDGKIPNPFYRIWDLFCFCSSAQFGNRPGKSSQLMFREL